jgi:hypothetical protein
MTVPEPNRRPGAAPNPDGTPGATDGRRSRPVAEFIALPRPPRRPLPDRDAPPETWRHHNCTASHRTANRFMRCAIPGAAWVLGEGEWALIAWCRTPTVTLWDTLEEAEQSRAWLDRWACGGACVRNHDIVRLQIGGRS